MRKHGEMITCFDCGEVKSRGDYHRSRLMTGCPLCRECANRRSREWRELNPRRVKELNRHQASLRASAERRYEDFPGRITCRVCAAAMRRKKFYLSSLAKGDRICKTCSNERTNRNRRVARGLPPKPKQAGTGPRLPDWSSF